MERPVNKRIIELMIFFKENKNSFSNILGVSPQTLKHIEDERNNPSFELIEAILLKYPTVNVEWLLLGKGNMFVENKTNVDSSETKVQELQNEVSDLKRILRLVLDKIDSYENKK